MTAKNISAGGVVCQLVTIPSAVSDADELEEWLGRFFLLHAYGRIAIEGGAAREIRLLCALRLVHYCRGALTEVLEVTELGYEVLVENGCGAIKQPHDVSIMIA